MNISKSNNKKTSLDLAIPFQQPCCTGRVAMIHRNPTRQSSVQLACAYAGQTLSRTLCACSALIDWFRNCTYHITPVGGPCHRRWCAMIAIASGAPQNTSSKVHSFAATIPHGPGRNFDFFFSTILRLWEVHIREDFNFLRQLCRRTSNLLFRVTKLSPRLAYRYLCNSYNGKTQT